MRTRLTLAAARKKVQFCDSYSRMHTIMLAAGHMDLADVRTLLGELWSICDNVGKYDKLLRMLLPDSAAPEMMTPEERAALRELPVNVTVYRGADRGVNEQGLCWSLDGAVAERFPFFIRYWAKNPVLVTATVRRADIVALKLDREEAEVITKTAQVLSVRPAVASKEQASSEKFVGRFRCR